MPPEKVVAHNFLTTVDMLCAQFLVSIPQTCRGGKQGLQDFLIIRGLRVPIQVAAEARRKFARFYFQ